MAPNDWDTLRQNFLLNTYYEADFTWNEHTVRRVGIRSRGTGSRSPFKPNLLVSFFRYDRSQRLLGLEAIVLKANNQDASLLKELVTMNLYRQMGMAAPREAPARLFINGEFFGAYTIVERIDTAFLDHNFGESAGYLYEWEAVREGNGYHFEYLGPDPEAYSPALFSPSNNESNPDPAPLEAMIRAINQSSDQDFVRDVSRYIDLPQFLRYIAVENFVADFDGILGTVFGMNNFYFYRFSGAELSYFLPWDKDNSFDWEFKPIFEGVEANVLARRAMQVPELRQVYLDALVNAARFAGGPEGWMASEIERLYALVGESARQDPNKQCFTDGVIFPCGATAFEQAVEHLRSFTRLRANDVIEQAQAAGYRQPTGAPRIAGVLDAFTGQPVAPPGGYISIYGQDLAGSTASAAEPWPRTMNGLEVLVDGARAPLLYLSPTQINAQIPTGTTSGPVGVNVRFNGRTSVTSVLYVQP